MVHKLGKVFTKEWRRVESAETEICIRCSCCWNNSSFILNSLGPLCLIQYVTSYTPTLDMSICIRTERYIREVIRTNGECLLFFHPPTLDAGK